MQALGMRGVAVLYLCLCSFASTNFTRSDIFSRQYTVEDLAIHFLVIGQIHHIIVFSQQSIVWHGSLLLLRKIRLGKISIRSKILTKTSKVVQPLSSLKAFILLL